MATSLGESIARRRVFWTLVGLVVVPTLALGFYGIAGLKNERDARESRLRDRYLLQSREVEAGVLARLATEDARVRAALRAVSPEDLDEAVEALARDIGVVSGAWLLGDPDLPPAVLAAASPHVAQLTDAEPVSFVTVNADKGPTTWAVSRVRQGRVVAYGISEDAIDAVVLPELVGRLFPNERATWRLQPVAQDGSAEPVSIDRLRRDLAERIVESDPLVDRALAPPFEHWRLTLEVEPEGPSNVTLATWTVLFLVVLVVVGVILMGRAVVQQTRLSRLQTDFVSNVSHELRTPLTSIRLFIETLQSGRVQEPDRVRECLDIVAAESERLSRKIERVLSWARMEAGRRTYDVEPRRPEALIARALAAFRAQQLDGGASVDTEVPPGLPAVMADAEAIEEALLNLLSNARKYGGEGVHIRVAAVRDGRFVGLVVKDDGPGIPLAERARIFEKFYRPDALLSRRTQGSGLGLAIVRAIAQAHRGKVSVESELGRGSAFTLRLRVAD
jgi:signal transduction histidine kinase